MPERIGMAYNWRSADLVYPGIIHISKRLTGGCVKNASTSISLHYLTMRKTIRSWRLEYDAVRPHNALQYQPPVVPLISTLLPCVT